MLRFNQSVLIAIILALFCSMANAQFDIQKVAKLELSSENAANQLRRKTQGRITGVREIEFTDDQSKVITAFYGCAVQLYDLKENTSIGELIRTSGDGQVGFINNDIAYTADWESVRLWDTNSGQQIGSAIPHELREDTIISPAIGPQGKLLATRPTMKSVQLWDATTRTKLGQPREFPSVVDSIRFTDDANTLLVHVESSLYALDTQNGQEVAGPVSSSWMFKHFTKKNRMVTTEQIEKGSQQLVIRATDEKGWPEVHRSDLPGRLKRIVPLSDDRILLQAATSKYTPELFSISLDQPKVKNEIETDSDRAFSLILPPDQRLWICSNIRNISCQSFGKTEPEWQLQLPSSGYDLKLYSLDNEYFVVHDKEKNFGIHKIADGTEVWTYPGVNRFSISNGKIALGCSDRLEIWELK